MTMLIAVADPSADAELIAAARALAKAAGWEARAVHVHEPGGPEPGSAELDNIELVELEGDPVAALSRLVDREGVDAFAVGLECQTTGLGHVAEAILGKAVAPLLLVRPGMRPLKDLKKMLVPLEGSPSTSAAMRAADDAFCKRGREIAMLHVVTSDTPSERGSLPAPRMMDQEHYEWAAWHDEFQMRFSACPEGGRHRVYVRVGDPASVIAKEAESIKSDLIILSWNGSFESGHGAVIQALLFTAPCPMMLVPSGIREAA